MNERRGSDIQRPTSHPWLQLTIALGLITPTKIQSTVLLEGEHLWTSGLAMRRKLMPSGNENRTVGLNVSSTPADFTTARTATCWLKPKRTRASLHNSKAHRPQMNVNEYCEATQESCRQLLPEHHSQYNNCFGLISPRQCNIPLAICPSNPKVQHTLPLL